MSLGRMVVMFSLTACMSGPPGLEDADFEPLPDRELDDSVDGVTDAAFDPDALPAGPDPCREALWVDVTGVTDGDTIEVRPVGGGWSEDVRLIGLDTPELGYDGLPDECGAVDARDFTMALVLGRAVWMTFDAECEDDYGRSLAYLHLSDGVEGFVNRRILADGYAEVMTIAPNNTFSMDFMQVEAEARSAERGIWSECP